MQDFKHFDPKQAAMDEGRGLLEAAARAAMADGSLPEKELPAFVVEVPNDVKNGDLASNFAMAGARVFGMPPAWNRPAGRGRCDARFGGNAFQPRGRSRAPASSTCSLPRAGLPNGQSRRQSQPARTTAAQATAKVKR